MPQDKYHFFQLVYEAYYQMIHEYLQHKASNNINEDERHSIVLATLVTFTIQVFSGKFEYRGELQLKGYLKKIAHNVLFRYLDNRKKALKERNRYDLENESSSHDLNDFVVKDNQRYRDSVIHEMSLKLYSCIKALKRDDDKEIFERYYDKKQSLKEIATTLQNNDGWVKGRLFQIRKQLKRCMGIDKLPF